MPIITCLSELCTSDNKNGGKACIDPTVTYTGAVLQKWEINGSDDSDFVAAVWDVSTGSVRTVEYASTRGWTYHNSATIDATPENIERAYMWATERWVETLTARAEHEASKPTKGKLVRSLTTRGKNVGVTGRVMWYGEDSYRSTRWLTAYRVGVKVEGEEKLRYLPADRVEVIEREPIDPNDIRQEAWLTARDRDFRSTLVGRAMAALIE
jgi:hypothetical protein